MAKKKHQSMQLTLPGMETSENKERENEVPKTSGEGGSDNFELQSPMLNEEVIERKNDIVLEAQPESNGPAEEPKEKPKPMKGFGKPSLNTATINNNQVEQKEETKGQEEEANLESKSEEQQEDQREEQSKPEIKEEPADDLPKMRGEKMDEAGDGTTLNEIKKKAGQTTAKWSWTLFENAGPKLQLFLTELDEAEFRKLVLEDLLPEEAIEFAKNYNESLEDEFRIKDWEKELIYPPLEEMLEKTGMNTTMSPGARFGLGVTVVLGARAMQTKKYRSERNELLSKLMSSYARSKKEDQEDATETK